MKDAEILFMQFMEAVNEWVDLGCPEDNQHGFSTRDSICFLLKPWFMMREVRDVESIESKVKVNELLQSYLGGYPRGCTPFNNRPNPSYGEEMVSRTHYKNKDRVAWIKSTVKSLRKKSRSAKE